MTCNDCIWSRNWCCGKKKAKGFIMCMNSKHQPPPMELKGTNRACNNFEIKENVKR